jgi:AcrR family transcriptional regulator
LVELMTDGRRRRAADSRDRIVTAMLELIAAGEITPRAEDVAVQAGVGLRTVFRIFRDMETLRAAMTARMAADYRMWLVPFQSADWRGQLAETIERRLTTFERLLPFKRASDAHRHESPSMQAEYRARLAAMRARLMSILPPEITGDSLRFEAIDLLLSPEAWQRLRDDQGLSPEAARAVIEAQVAGVVGA